MTDFLPWTPEEYAPEAPITSLDMRRWFENPVAMFEGSAGAPRLRLGALPRLAAGAVPMLISDAVRTVPAGSTEGVLVVPFAQKGAVRVTWQDKAGWLGQVTSSLLRWRSGAEITLANFQADYGWTVRTVDAAIQAGDVLEVRLSASNSVGYLQSIRILTDGREIWPGVAGLQAVISGGV